MFSRSAFLKVFPLYGVVSGVTPGSGVTCGRICGSQVFQFARSPAERRMERLGHEQPARSWPQIYNLVGTGTEGDDRLGLAALEHVEELVPPVLNGRGGRDRLGLCVDLVEDLRRWAKDIEKT